MAKCKLNVTSCPELSGLEYIKILHGRHEQAFYQVWFNEGDTIPKHTKKTVEQIEPSSFENQPDKYISMNGYLKSSVNRQGEYLNKYNKYRTKPVPNVSVFPSYFIDFDYYKSDYADLTKQEIIDLIFLENQWLPIPTIIVYSGNGFYFVWCFEVPLLYEQSDLWVSTTSHLIKKLSKYGADYACKDLPRFLRVPGSINSKSTTKPENRLVRAFRTGGYHD